MDFLLLKLELIPFFIKKLVQFKYNYAINEYEEKK